MDTKPIEPDVVEKAKQQLLAEEGSGMKYKVAKDDRDMDFLISFINNCKIVIMEDTESKLNHDSLATTSYDKTVESMGYELEGCVPTDLFKNEVREVLHAIMAVK